jgi:glyoxylase-like metal-dependent hydrolase (beta-lactamase superfamily II)
MTLDSNVEIYPGVTLHCTVIGGRRVQHYALGNQESTTLFDCGLLGFCDFMDGPGRECVYQSLIISHADVDHFGNASFLKASLGNLQILAHPADRCWIEDPASLVATRYDYARPRFNFGYDEAMLIEFRRLCGGGVHVDGLLEKGDTIQTGITAWRVLHVPGHSPGHIALWDAASGTLLLGDAILGLGVPGIDSGVSMPPTHQFIADYIETITQLESLPVKLALTGHWPPLNAVGFRQLLADSRLCVERDLAFVRKELAEGTKRFDTLMAKLNQTFRRWPVDQDEHYFYALAGYIDYLENLGELVVLDGEIRTI